MLVRRNCAFVLSSSRPRQRRRAFSTSTLSDEPQRKQLEALRSALAISSNDDWYKVPAESFTIDGSLLDDYHGSRATLLNKHYPGHTWHEWMFEKLHPRQFGSISNQRAFLDWFMKEHHFATMDDWYSVTNKDIIKQGGFMILKHTKQSLNAALKKVYPEHDWIDWKFRKLPHRFWKDKANRRRFFDYVAKQLNITSFEGWYRVSKADIYKMGGSPLVAGVHKDSYQRLLAEAYPEHRFQKWKFGTVGPRFWEDKASQREFFDELAVHANVKTMDDWYNISLEQIAEFGGGGLMSKHYDNSPALALAAVYPEHTWHFDSPDAPRKFYAAKLPKLSISPEHKTFSDGKRLPRHYWKDLDNRLEFLRWFAAKRGLDDPNHPGWYKVSQRDFAELGGSSLLQRYYSGSTSRAISELFPEHRFEFWKFDVVPKGVWADPKNKLTYLAWLGTQLRITQLEQWYTQTPASIIAKGGGSLLMLHRNSMVEMLRDVFPTHNWLPWRFNNVPQGWWADHDNQRAFCDWFMEQAGLDTMEGWYSVTTQMVRDHGGGTLIKLHAGSIPVLVSVVYPSHGWVLWRFDKVPNGYWSDMRNRKEFFDWAGAELGVSRMEDWLKIRSEDVDRLGGSGLLSNYYKDSMAAALRSIYPDHPWERPLSDF